MKLVLSFSDNTILSIFKLIELLVEAENDGECLVVLTPEQISVRHAAECFDHYRKSQYNYSFFAKDFDVKQYGERDGNLSSTSDESNIWIFTDGYQNIGFQDSYSEVDQEIWKNILIFD